MTARTTDPATSHLAAVHVAKKLPSLKAAFIQALQVLGASTANEVAAWCVEHGIATNAESVRKRSRELDVGLVRPAGTRTCRITGQLAGTLELTNANTQIHTEQNQRTSTKRRESTSDSGRTRKSGGHCESSQGQQVACVLDKKASQVQTLEAQRIEAAAEFLRNERELTTIFHVAVELSSLAKANPGSWPEGDSNQYIVAIEEAAARGLVERKDQRVRRLTQKPVEKVVQKGLFDAD